MRVFEVREFEDSESVARALAAAVADRLTDAIAARGRATLAVSGGTTPVRFFQALSNAEIDWDRVVVTLVDERFVGPSSERSNERLVRETLLVGRAARAGFVPIYSQVENVELAAEAASEAVAGLLPLDVVVLGMGTDGHTASLFPDAEHVDALLDPATGRTVIAVHAPSAGEPRLTLSLGVICKARAVFLHIEGDAKRAVFDGAAARNLPIAKVVEAAKTPVVTYWAP